MGEKAARGEAAERAEETYDDDVNEDSGGGTPTIDVPVSNPVADQETGILPGTGSDDQPGS